MIAAILIVLSSLCVVAAAVLQVKTYRNLLPRDPAKEVWIPDDTSRYPVGTRVALACHRWRIAFCRWRQERLWRKGRKWRHASANVAFVRLDEIIAADRRAVPCGRWVRDDRAAMAVWMAVPERFHYLFDIRPRYRWSIRK